MTWSPSRLGTRWYPGVSSGHGRKRALRRSLANRDDDIVEDADQQNVAAVLSALFHINAGLVEISDDTLAIRRILEGDDEEAEEDEPEP